MNAQRVASSPRRRGSFFPSFVPPLFLAYSTRLHAQSPLRLPLVILAGESSPVSRSHESGNLTPFGASGFTPERSGLPGSGIRRPGCYPASYRRHGATGLSRFECMLRAYTPILIPDGAWLRTSRIDTSLVAIDGIP